MTWRSLGLIGRQDDGNDFAPEDVEKVRLIQLALKRGISLERLRQYSQNVGGLMWAPYRDVSSTGVRRYTLQEAAEHLGVDLDLLRRLWQATSLYEPWVALDDEDMEAVVMLKNAVAIGFPEEAVMQITRVYADGFARMAEAETRLFHFYVQERLRASGLSDAELNQVSGETSTRLYELVEPALLYFHRKALQRAAREDALLHFSEDAGLVEKGEVEGQLYVAIMFVDISSFTPLADVMGDVAAAHVLARFAQLVRESVGRHEGRVTKQIGDAFMVLFPSPQAAVICALDIERMAADEEQFPAVRAGVHWGPVLYREGDYVGSNVNIASRVASEATRHQVLVTADVRKEAGDLPDVGFIPLGSRRLRGLSEEVELYEARPVGAEGRDRQVDPVCGMELRPEEVAARITQDGDERVFCSQDCLRRYLTLPGYAVAEPSATPER
jgi:class 3 adenylate cyclase/YHS domain-containing protein